MHVARTSSTGIIHLLCVWFCLSLQVLRLRRRFNAIHSDYLDSRLSVIAEVNAKRKRCGEIKEVRARHNVGEYM